MNRFIDAAVGGWELSSILSWQTGMPWTLNGSTEFAGSVHIDQQNSPKVIRGANTSCVGQWKQDKTGAWELDSIGSSSSCAGAYNFIVTPNYGVHPNVVFTGVRNPRTSDLDASFSKSFQIVERIHAQFRLDAFNVPNHPAFASNYDNSPTDSNFGTLIKSSTGQSNQPRNVQLTVKVIW
jgi:hypothetical protein